MLAVGGAVLLALALAPLALWISRKGALLWAAGVDVTHLRTMADRARYTSMGAIVMLTATAATASLTVALTLVFGAHDWVKFLPVGLVWGAIVFNFDRWIVSGLDYGPLTAADTGGKGGLGRRSHSMSKGVHFVVRFTTAALVGLVISEPIVLAVFGPEIRQQLTVQHLADIKEQTSRIESAAGQQAALLNGPVNTAKATLTAAKSRTRTAHKVYICELTAQCHLPAGEVTGVAGLGPQTSQDYALWRQAERAQNTAQQAFNRASASQARKVAALNLQTKRLIANTTKTVNADNGLLAREKALDTLSRQNGGFLLRRVMLWLALMFIDLAPVLLKTFSPPTLYELLARSDAVEVGRNAMKDAMATADHQSAKKAITREFDLKYHRMITELEYSLRVEAVRAGHLSGQEDLGHHGEAERGRPRTGERPWPSPGGGMNSHTGDGGWVIGHRWKVRRPLAGVPSSGRVPFVATDLHGEYVFEVVVKIIAPPPRVAGSEALRERRHAQMEMSLPQGHIHENIAEILDSDLDREHGFYLVTRLYPGTLEQRLHTAEEQHALTMDQVLHLAVQILAGLRAAWECGIVHLDLKPANIAIADDGTVKLIDFGLAQRYQEANGGNDTMNAARFTPFYAPPEQMERRDASWISRYADLRALGAVIYRMLTGYPPILREARAIGLVDPSGRFDPAAYFDLVKLVATVEPIPVAELIPHVPQELDRLLRAWLRIDPQMRCPGNPGTMPERAWIELSAVAEQVQAANKSGDLVGGRVTLEPEFTDLREQWSGRPPGRKNAGAGDARSQQTLEAMRSTLPACPPTRMDAHDQ
jgi:serine/threonine protein kinase